MDRLRRVLRLYGPTGAATGWRLWIDAWALAQREPDDPQGAAPDGPALVRVLREVVETASPTGVFRCADPAGSVARVSALLDGLSVAALVYRTVSRAQLREWVDGLRSPSERCGLESRHLTPASAPGRPGR